ncbi:hypothetical protein ADK70_31860 [Streptomyces rimosus subsp. pseudoverticillatus]|uniref:hypothetical protein n=1 Tax=Streptomyces rimosus TaxID=1927 RepID=UPI0006B29C21|nr:hypothetical protein [Streptomyces rimosus]KOT79110.1 hypothetical protein ADK70_31860 [Streptomyces rimosus subsp. pseudoverticillatus]
MKRPAHYSDTDWAEYQQCQAEHDDIMNQVADREAQIEQGLIDTYDDYEFDFTSPARPAQQPRPARQSPPIPTGSAARKSSRRR